MSMRPDATWRSHALLETVRNNRFGFVLRQAAHERSIQKSIRRVAKRELATGDEVPDRRSSRERGCVPRPSTRLGDALALLAENPQSERVSGSGEPRATWSSCRGTGRLEQLDQR